MPKLNTKDDRKLIYIHLWKILQTLCTAISKGDSTKLDAYYAAYEKVKDDYPKPS